MSIIYEALQKTQANREYQRTKFRIPFFDLGLLIINIILIIIVSIFYYHHFTKRTDSIAIKHPPIVKKIIKTPPLPVSTETIQESKPIIKPRKFLTLDYTGSLVLNGVFISENETVALINNQTHHLGDIVDNMKIISISMDNIKLAKDQNIYVMHSQV